MPNPSTEQGWRIGVLYSRSGVTATTESQHFFGSSLALEEINQGGGVLGKPLIPVVYDPRSSPEHYRRQAARLLLDDDINVIFGGCTSHCRKAMLPLIERHNALLWYASVYEGFEYSPNVIYSGAAPNQGCMQLAAWLMGHCGTRFALVGSDYVYPHETNRIMRDTVEQYGGEIALECYLPLGSDKAAMKALVQRLLQSAPDAVFSTFVGTDAELFYRLSWQAGLRAQQTPIASLTMSEAEVAKVGADCCAGHLTAATWFASLQSPANTDFLQRWKQRFADLPVSTYAQTAYSQMHLFARALAQTASLDSDKLRAALYGLELQSPSGRLQILQDNHHCLLTPYIGRCRLDGQFDVLWQSEQPVRPDPYLVAPCFDALAGQEA
ncbi:amino acid ABC transporter substrate-binding protein [Ventosimonas gracilis]|uniref:Amino acid ABC transporter substrate-binding protein n=1 Tax=Ventosimonas gracilis TaxID=1680762 RepID=A0A139SRU1_9GAMM|nr:transporter substrate-binding domain-containing protein [Ventosimonas gracilis]KXU37263.1 amino acid ABC transporter substrate-binding protein [Ventosimonas gracilis]